jgi:hypothetical protein
MLQRQALLEDRERLCTQYVAAMATVLDALLHKNQADESLKELRQKFALARNQPELILSRSGPFIWEYRADISAGQVDRLLGNNYEEKVSQELSDSDQIDFCNRIIGKIRNTWKSLSKLEQEHIVKQLKSMLAAFAGHVSVGKALAELDAARQEREQRTGQRLAP